MNKLVANIDNCINKITYWQMKLNKTVMNETATFPSITHGKKEGR